ncbi:membrane protease FtsH catalytic subunit [Dongia mobilis]|uniref:ATP-dependent zinc metalloprotease FtsH n=2 Tax=Dongia mobilis TaxID=578943 RepID=A0A4R6WH73_9PROT|nr:membrane protease FtsH catalytic subunit [Dongia mobilis]
MNWGKNLMIWVAIGLLLIALFKMFEGDSQRSGYAQLSYSQFLAKVNEGAVSDVTIRGPEITGHASGQQFTTYAPEDPKLVETLSAKGVEIKAGPLEDGTSPLMQILISWAPLIIIVGIWIFFMRQMQGQGGKAMGFGKSRAKLLTERTGRVTFDDVAGIEEAKGELEEIVEFLKDPQKFQRLGGKIPKGCLLVGPPGTGKTLLARAIAGEANVPFFTISGSDFVEMFVGVGASRVRDMFEQGKKNAPCIIFIDEIDAVGRHRGAGLGGGNDEREQTLNQMLVEMDGFDANEGVIIIAATNRPDVLDPALLRPGRFDRQITVPNPDINGREQILKVHMRKVPLGPDVDARVIARGTPGFSGADLANLVNEAALMAARFGKRVVTMSDFEQAKDKVMMGSERRSMVMTPEEKLATAYHEAGHAIVNLEVPEADPLHKVTIIPRGRALGLTMSLPEKDRYSISKRWLESRIAICFGGRIAEQLIYGEEHLNSGASNDIQQATEMARRMVTEFGMSDRLGPLRYTDNDQDVFLGYQIGQQRKNMSDETSKLIDQEVRRIVEAGEGKCRDILTANLEALHKVAKALVEFETLSGEEVRALMKGEDIRRDTGQGGGAAAPAKPRSPIPTSTVVRPLDPKPQPGT